MATKRGVTALNMRVLFYFQWPSTRVGDDERNFDFTRIVYNK